MAQSSAERLPGELGYGAWFCFWGELVVLGLAAVLGAFVASADALPGDYACGLILAVAAVALAFLRLKARFDGAAAGWGGFLLVDDIANLVVVVVVFAILGLAGLFVAAGFDGGGLHAGGVALFVVSGIAVFLNLKHAFDRLEARR